MQRINKPVPQRPRAVAKALRTDVPALAATSFVIIAAISLILRALS